MRRGLMTATRLTENKELVHEYHEVLENRQVDRIREFYADDYTVEMMQLDGSDAETGDVDDVVDRMKSNFEAFPDATIEEKEMAAEGHWVLCRIEITATHDGAFHGIEPTGREVSMQVHESYRVEDGEFVETHSTASLTPLLGQLGIELPIEA